MFLILGAFMLYDRDVTLWAENDEDDEYDDSEELAKLLADEEE